MAGVISNKTLLVFITFTGIRRVTAWVADLFTFFWYVNMSRIAELEGEKRWSSAGGYVIWGTLASLFGGLVAMAVCMATARPLLRLLTPPVADQDLIVDLGSNALIIAEHRSFCKMTA